MIQILLATYNGDPFLKCQLDSILSQDYPNIQILIRDDGSTDKTMDIIEAYSKRYTCIHYYKGEHIGVIESFFDLIKHADTKARYIAFADQDDYWFRTKLSRAIRCIKMGESLENKPFLYCSSRIIVNQDFSRCFKKKNRCIEPHLGNAIVENIATGASMVFNQMLLEKVKGNIPLSEDIVMYDFWIYLVALVTGNVYYDSAAYYYYRIHDKNVVGAAKNVWEQYGRRIRNFRKFRGKLFQQTCRLSEFCKDNNLELEESVISFLRAKHNIGERIRLIKSGNVYRNSYMDNCILKVLLLLGIV